MLRAVPKRWYSADYKVLEDDTTIAVIDASLMREAAELTIKASTYRAYREGLMSGAFIFEGAGAVLARAVKPSALYRKFEVELEGRHLTLEADSIWTRKFVLSEKGVPVGSVYPEHAFTKKAVIDFPEEISLPGRIFLFWLVMILWRRAQEASASS